MNEFDKMLREYYAAEAAAIMARGPGLFEAMRFPPPTRSHRAWRFMRRVVRWPFARLAYLFARVGGVSFDREE